MLWMTCSNQDQLAPSVDQVGWQMAGRLADQYGTPLEACGFFLWQRREQHYWPCQQSGMIGPGGNEPSPPAPTECVLLGPKCTSNFIHQTWQSQLISVQVLYCIGTSTSRQGQGSQY